MKPVDKFSEYMLVSAISAIVTALIIALILFGYILVRNIIEKNKNKKEK
jgi:hypothetical protein